MPNKIFISYRREDAGANALGISQYLEKEFGRKNVFIDVDMRAGAKFPTVLEERLAECKVMLVLIGAEWLSSRNERGERRLDLPDDWVRLEIARALKRDITVIPVQVNGAPLPSKENLPDDIRSLLDYQAVSLTLASFRNEMSGLVRDIRAIKSPRPWRWLGLALAAGVAAGVIAASGAYLYGKAVSNPVSIVEMVKSVQRQIDNLFKSGQPTASGPIVAITGIVTGNDNVQFNFRAIIQKQAIQYNLGGSVRNSYNGGLRFILQGAPDRIEKCVETIRKRYNYLSVNYSNFTTVDPELQTFTVFAWTSVDRNISKPYDFVFNLRRNNTIISENDAKLVWLDICQNTLKGEDSSKCEPND